MESEKDIGRVTELDHLSPQELVDETNSSLDSLDVHATAKREGQFIESIRQKVDRLSEMKDSPEAMNYLKYLAMLERALKQTKLPRDEMRNENSHQG